MNRFQLIHGNNIETLKRFKDNTFHSVVTSPPYWSLRDYGVKEQFGQEDTPEEFVSNLVAIMKEVKRVLRTDGTCWLNLGDSYNNSSGHVRSKQEWQRKGRSNGSADKKAFKHSIIKTKDLVGMPWRCAFALQEAGWYLRCDVIWCLSGGAEVYIKSGDKEFPLSIKDIYRLKPENVKLWNGEKWTQMVSMVRNNQKHNEVQFVLRSGERVCCTPTHRWPTERGVLMMKELVVGDVIKTCSLPEPLICNNHELVPDDEIGWFVGIYLAEGSKSGKTIQISSHQKEDKRFKRLNKIAKKYHGQIRLTSQLNKGSTFTISLPVNEEIKDGKNKNTDS